LGYEILRKSCLVKASARGLQGGRGPRLKKLGLYQWLSTGGKPPQGAPINFRECEPLPAQQHGKFD